MTLLDVKNIDMHYAQRPFLFQRKQEVPVLQKVSFSLQEGECLGIVGQSGSGKSTLGRIILGIERPTNGELLFQGVNLYEAPSKHKKEYVEIYRQFFKIAIIHLIGSRRFLKYSKNRF